MSAGGPQHILDAGCGTGHHLARIAAALGPGVAGLGLDISPAAAHLAARQWPDIAFAVVDLWADWPVHDASVDFVVSIFAPRNFAETARVLRSGGWLALIYPGANHLAELRHRYRLMGQHEDKRKHYAEAANRTIGPPAVTRIILNPAVDLETATGFAAPYNWGEQLKPVRGAAAGRAGGPSGSV